MQVRISKAVLALENNPFPSGCKKLKNRDGFRSRVGDCRVLYLADQKRSGLSSVPSAIAVKFIATDRPTITLSVQKFNFSILLLSAILLAPASHGSLLETNLPSKFFGWNRGIHIYLPPSYGTEPQRRYPVFPRQLNQERSILTTGGLCCFAIKYQIAKWIHKRFATCSATVRGNARLFNQPVLFITLWTLR